MSHWCAWNGIAGPPRKGFHARRIPWLDVALWDVIGTVLIAVAIAYLLQVRFAYAFLTKERNRNAVRSLPPSLMVFATLVHWLLCVETRILSAMH